MKYLSQSVKDTYNLASVIASNISGGSIILLNGDLGAGKTTFVKGFAASVGIKDNVTSPTFTLLKTYKTDAYTLVHVDAYRLDGDSFDELYDYINQDTVLFIEWSNMLESDFLLDNRLEINIKYIDENTREYELVAYGNKYESILKEIEARV